MESPNRSRLTRRRSGYGSDDLDASDDGDEGDQPKTKKAKLAKAALAKAKAKAKAKQKKKKGDASGSDDDDEDEYNALPIKNSRRITDLDDPTARPPIGSLEECAECHKEFTMTRYTVAADPGPGWLCHACAKAAGIDPFKKVAPRKRKAPTEKRKVVSYEDVERIPTLSGICIKVITQHLEDVEALGDIGVVSMNEILRVIAKARSLTAENSQLFYNVKNTTLTIYDATNLKPDALCALASLNPNLESLRLDYCGLIEGTAVEHWSNSLPHLKRIELLGPFLVRVPAWIKFFESKGPQLTSFLVTQSPRFDITCIESLVTQCPNLTELRLKEIGLMADSFLPHIAKLSDLTYLDLSRPKESLGDQAVVDLLAAIGGKLTHLDLSHNAFLSDVFLEDGVLPYTPVLTTLILSGLDDLTDRGVSKFFKAYRKEPPLIHADLSRCHELASDALTGLLDHSGRDLVELNINSWKDTSNDTLMTIASKASRLVRVDISWCREADDFVVKSLLDGCSSLAYIKCYGCNHVTDACPKKRGVNIYGVESHVAS
ncbi:RNI-like protein [Sistotremastrum suecicum HHB10207 ss-3]|uniref:RNI-like protein n=1 Tax=Sistotremastrum suecicum HHB10207 ss-3 TaxID=1314776 RepID=A0A166FWB6_9AGAM|nr:RNI-like protein [Sistotremastrum suecicum HHB10207 ss-3]